MPSIPTLPAPIHWGRPLPESVGDPRVVRQLIERALTVDPERAALHVQLAHVHLDQLDFRGAVPCLERAIALEPDASEARMLVARCYNMLGRPDAAIRILAPLAGSNYERAAALAELGDAGAEAEFRAVLLRQPNDARACRLLSRLLRRSGRHHALLELCETLFDRGAVSAQLLYNWGVALALTGDTPRAKRLMFDPGHIARMPLPVPDGFADIAAFNAAMAAALLADPAPVTEFPEEFEANRGSRRIDNLFHGPRAALAGLLVKAFQRAADEYRPVDRPGFDPWPALRPAAARIRPWGLLQRNAAYEAGHIHPLGWLSGVYYVRVPKAVSTGNGPGALAFGQPASLRTELTRSAHYVPQEGMLLMAPSHYEHWTIPSGLDEERISIAFDIVPEAHGVLTIE